MLGAHASYSCFLFTLPIHASHAIHHPHLYDIPSVRISYPPPHRYPAFPPFHGAPQAAQRIVSAIYLHPEGLRIASALHKKNFGIHGRIGLGWLHHNRSNEKLETNSHFHICLREIGVRGIGWCGLRVWVFWVYGLSRLSLPLYTPIRWLYHAVTLVMSLCIAWA